MKKIFLKMQKPLLNDEKLRKLQNKRLNFLFPIFVIGYFVSQSLDTILRSLFSNIFVGVGIAIFVVAIIFLYQIPSGKKFFENIKNYFLPMNSQSKNLNIDFKNLEQKFIQDYNLFLDPNFKTFETNNISDQIISQVKDLSKTVYKSNFQILSKNIFESSFGEFCIWSCKTDWSKHGSYFDIISLPKFVKNENISQNTTPFSNILQNSFYSRFSKGVGIDNPMTHKSSIFFLTSMGVVCGAAILFSFLDNIFPRFFDSIRNNDLLPGLILIVIFFGFAIYSLKFILNKNNFSENRISISKNDSNSQLFLTNLGLSSTFDEIINFDNKTFLITGLKNGFSIFEPFLFDLNLDQAKENVIYRLVEARKNYENLKNAMKLV